MKVCVLIPTYNESQVIGKLIREVRKQNNDILIVDDGSVDETVKIAGEQGANILQNERNLGKGASLIKGFEYIYKNDYDAVITMDGDGQHNPEEIKNFFDAAQKSNAEIYVGNRMAELKNMPLARIITNKFMSWLISIIARQHIPDTQCGFRLIRKNALARIRLTTSKYETESEILIKAARLGFKIESVPIKTIYSREKSHINPFTDTCRFIRFILKEIWITP